MATSASMSKLLLSLLLISLLSLPTTSSDPLVKLMGPIANANASKFDCVYNLFVRTGRVSGAGTDSIISITLMGSDGSGVNITDLVKWGGLMGSKHDYFEWGNLDMFAGRLPCLTSAPCKMNITSDGAGSGPGWFCNYIEVTTTRPHTGCIQQMQMFDVDQWLALEAGYKMYAYRNYCLGESGSGGYVQHDDE